MSKNTATLNIVLKAADDTISKLVKNSVSGVKFPNGNVVEREYTTDHQAVTHIGLASATLTVVIPAGAVDLNFTIGSATFEFLNVTAPVVLPGSITSVQMKSSAQGVKRTILVFQGS